MEKRLDTAEDRKTIGKAVRELRLARGMSQLDLALMIGTGKSQISQLEAGGANIGIDSYIRAARTLDAHLEIVSNV